MMGVKDLFDGILKPQLLYKLEMPQYNAKIIEDQTPSNVYGSAHLLRLMVKIGPLLNRSSLDTSCEGNVTLIENILNDFLLYLETHRSRLFTSKNYTQTANDYPVDEAKATD